MSDIVGHVRHPLPHFDDSRPNRSGIKPLVNDDLNDLGKEREGGGVGKASDMSDTVRHVPQPPTTPTGSNRPTPNQTHTKEHTR